MAVTIAGRSLVRGVIEPILSGIGLSLVLGMISLSLLQRRQGSGNGAIDKCRRTPTQDEEFPFPHTGIYRVSPLSS